VPEPEPPPPRAIGGGAAFRTGAISHGSSRTASRPGL